MNKQEFLSAFQRAMESLGVTDQAAHYGFFEELFSDMSEEGISEEEISSRLGDPWELAASLLREEEGRAVYSGRKETPPPTADIPNERDGSPDNGEEHSDWEKKVEKIFNWRNGFLRLLREPGKLSFDVNIGSENEDFETQLPVSGIDELEINWRSGELEVKAEEREDILLAEDRSANAPPLRAEVRGSCLCVFFAERPCGSKDLTVVLPTALAVALRRCAVSTISADADLSGMVVRELKVHTVSGGQDIRVKADRAEFSSASGDMELSVEADELTVNTASGDLSLLAANSGSVKLSTASGDIECRGDAKRITMNSASGCVEYSGYADQIQVKTASGDCDLSLDNCPNSLDVTSVSGDVEVRLPKDSAVNLQLKSRSGNIRFSGIRTDVADAPVFNFSTVSGDINVYS